jgi:hypothetical protein
LKPGLTPEEPEKLSFVPVFFGFSMFHHRPASAWLMASCKSTLALETGYPVSERPVNQILAGEKSNRRANWNFMQLFANMGKSCRTECIRAESNWEKQV